MMFKLAIQSLLAFWAIVPADAKMKREGNIFSPVQAPVEAPEPATEPDAPLAAGEMLISSKDKYVDGLCVEFCDDYFYKYCYANNIYLNSDRRRNLVSTAETNLNRGGDVSTAIEQCHQACMSWPRGIDPFTYQAYTDPDCAREDSYNSIMGGDTFWCRQKHMFLVKNQEDQAFHCYHATNQGGGICRDALVNGYTPYELLRDGENSCRHFGYCDLAGDDTIADCSGQTRINDSNLDKVLRMMPDSVQVIFLNGIPDITDIPADAFSKFSDLQALYINDCPNLATISENALRGLGNLKIFNADNNESITTIPETLFKDSSDLRQISMFQNPITDIPAKLFENTKNIERIVLYGNSITEFPPGVFAGLKKLTFLAFPDTGLCSETYCIPDDTFDDLESLQYFDIFLAPNFTKLKARWFNVDKKSESKMGKNLIRIAMWNNPSLTEVEEELFTNLKSLEMAYFHGTEIEELDPDFFMNKKNFAHLTL